MTPVFIGILFFLSGGVFIWFAISALKKRDMAYADECYQRAREEAALSDSCLRRMKGTEGAKVDELLAESFIHLGNSKFWTARGKAWEAGEY